MTRQVFISYSATDRDAAESICGALEDRGVSCWIAPRNIPPGAEWPVAIMAGIADAGVLLLVHSAASSGSQMVRREINVAADNRKSFVPVRIDQSPPHESIQFFLGSTQWLDVSVGPLREHLPRIAAAVSERLGLEPAIRTVVPDGCRHSRAAGTPPVTVPLTLPDKPSIAVLPFQNLSGDLEQEYFVDGMVEDIITELSRFRALFVIARNSAFTYKGRAADVQLVARELGVRYVVEGSVRKSRNRVRVTAQLIDAATGNHLWAERYDQTLEDVFVVQEEVTRSIVASVAPWVELTEMAEARRLPRNDTALELTWRARAVLNDIARSGRPALVIEVIDTANQAIAADPSSLAACFILATAHWVCHVFRWGPDPPAALDAMWSVVEHMQTINPVDDRTLTLCGMARIIRGENERGIADMRRALELNPNSAHTLMYLAFYEASVGLYQDAQAHAHSAIRLNPKDERIGTAYLALAMGTFCAREYTNAIHWTEMAIQSQPTAPVRRALMIACCAYTGDLDQAARERVALDRFAPNFIPSLLRGESSVFKRPEDLQHLLEGLRKAGMPD